MAELRNYKNNDFSVTINNRMNGIEIRYEKKLTEDQIEKIKDAGFRWSKRQQIWYAYQNEKSIEFVSLIESAYEEERQAIEDPQIQYAREQSKNEEVLDENLIKNSSFLESIKIIPTEQVENKLEEITIDELVAMVKQRAELDRKIAAIKEVISNDGSKIDVSNEQAKDFAVAMHSLENTVQEQINENNKEIVNDIQNLEEHISPEAEHDMSEDLREGMDFALEAAKEAGNYFEINTIDQFNEFFKTDYTEQELRNQHLEHLPGADVSDLQDLMAKEAAAILVNDFNLNHQLTNEESNLDAPKEIAHRLAWDIINGDYTNLEQVESEYFNQVETKIEVWNEEEKEINEEISSTPPTQNNEQNSVELEIEDLDIAKKLVPPMEYATMLDYATHGEEQEHYKERIKHIAHMGRKLRQNANGKSYNEETELHDKGFVHYYIGNSDWYISEIDDDNIGFGFAVLNGDTEMAEFGYINLDEITSLKIGGMIETEIDLYIDDTQSMEHAICKNYPELRFELLPESEWKFDLNEEIFKKEEITASPVELEEILNVMDFNIEVQNDGTMKVYDTQRNEYLDNRQENDNPEDDLKYNSAEQIFDRMDIYINDHFIEDMKEQLEIGGVTLNGNESLKELCDYAKEQLEAGIHTVSKEEYDLAMGIVNPDTVIMPELYHEEIEQNTNLTSRDIRSQVKELLANHTDEEISANKEYLNLLSQYEGGGGLNEDGRTNAEVLNAFYTPRNIVNAVWQLADHYAPNAKTVLEPSSGIGRFAENRPQNEFTLRELDETSAHIAKILHPEAEVIQGAFQAQFFDKTGRVYNQNTELPKYDLVIGNPPYGTYSNEWKGRGEGKNHNRIEEYFIEKGLDSLKDENSLLAFIVPSGWLRSGNDKIKELIASKGTLIDAYRLPNGAFDSTDVGTDIVLLKKETRGESDWDADLFGLEWREHLSYFNNDQFFKQHPEKILGVESTRSGRFGEENCVNLPEGVTLKDELAKIGEQLGVNKETANTITEEDRTSEEKVNGYNVSSEVSNWCEEKYKDFDANSDLSKTNLYSELNEMFVEGKDAANSFILEADYWACNQMDKTDYANSDELVKIRSFFEVLRASYGKNNFENYTYEAEKIINRKATYYKKHPVNSVHTTIDAYNAARSPVLSKSLKEQIYEKYIEADIEPVFSDKEGYARKIAQELASALETRRLADVGTIRSHLSLNNDRISFEEKKLVKEIFEENTGLKLPEFINDHDVFDKQMNQVVSEWANDSLKEEIKPSVTPGSSLQSEPVAQKKPVLTKSPVMTAEDFNKLYGKQFKEEDLPIWKATNWEGIIDRSKLSFEEDNQLHSNPNYVEVEPGKFTHKVLFESGDIAEKKVHYQNEINTETDSAKLELYKKNLAHLESVTPPLIPMERLHFGVNTTLAEEFEIEQINEEGKIEKINLQESFILWAAGHTLQSAYSDHSRYWRGGIDFTTANISEEDFPSNVSWNDIVDYIDKKPVKADKVLGTWRKDEDEIKAEKAQHKKEADEKRMARSETADKLFDKYLHEGLSEKVREQVVAEYNRRFNSYIIPDYSKLPLFISGMSRTKGNEKFKLYDQQIKGVSFLSNKGNGLLAYDVGVGKTATGIVANVSQIQTGRSSRPLIVVPNAVYSKWLKDITELFPNIKVNDLYNLNKQSSAKFRNTENPHKLNIPEGSISLVTYEGLKNITFTDSSCENELFDDFSKLLSEDMDGTAVENAKNADKIKGVIGAASQVKNDDFVFFEDCGWDNITVDEAHNFKNLWTVPKPKTKGQSNEFAGIPSGKPSARAVKLYAMTQLTQRQNEDRNVFLLTATPFTNSPLEVYSMLSYVGRKRLLDAGLYSLRDFCNEFAHTKLELGVNSKGEIDQKQVMKDWKELPALQKILTEFIDKVDGEELKEIIRPKKFIHVQQIEMSDLQKKMMEIDTIKMSEVKEGNTSAVITSMNAMRLALVAPALADEARYSEFEIKLPSMKDLVETSPKLKFVCDSIIELYKKNPEKGQFLYLPFGKEAHGMIKDYLVEHGISKEAVEIINGEINNSTDKKYKVTSKFNDPNEKCKIFIGGRNTSEGIDLNGNSFVMYNSSLGWNPSETIQAEGRIWRQGNMQGHTHCCYPVMNDSIDSVLYQKHDEKRSRINELWTYKDGDTLNIEDINPEDLKFDLIKDPQKRAKMILEQGIEEKDSNGNIIFKFEGTNSIQNELNKIESRLKSFDEVYEKRIKLKDNLEETNIDIKRLEKSIDDYKSRDLEIPEWCKLDLKDKRKYRENYERQLETIAKKFNSWGIKSEEDLNNFVPSLNSKKHELESLLKTKKEGLPKILERETLKMNEQKILLPPVEKQIESFTSDIQNNLRPMKEVEPEIRKERFEEMLSKKWEKGEITTEEKKNYSAAGYKAYYEWLDGELESLEPVVREAEQKAKVQAVVQEAADKITEIAKSSKEPVEVKIKVQQDTQGWLFNEEELQVQSVTEQKKVHQLITYDSDGNGFDEQSEYTTLSEAQNKGKALLKEWNLDESSAGFIVYNIDTKMIESKYGTFPVEQAFSNEVLKLNGYQLKDNVKESSVTDVAQQIKDKIVEQTGASKEWADQHLIISTPKPIKTGYSR